MVLEAEDISIVLVEILPSVFSRGVKNRLVELDFNVTEVKADLREIGMHLGKADLFILHLPEEITANKKQIKFLDALLPELQAKNQRVLLMGTKSDIIGVTSKLSGYKKYGRLLDPVNLKTLEDTIMDSVTSGGPEEEEKRILIVDDDPSYAKFVKGWIGDAFQSNIVTNGTQAITFLATHDVDLILLDYEMPVVDGPQVLEMIRNEEDFKDIPVVFLTGVASKESVSRVMALSPDGYILKSTNKEELMKKIREVLKKH